MKRAVSLPAVVCGCMHQSSSLFVAVTADVVYLTGILRDQAPNTMKDYSTGSSCGSANKTQGFWGTDFELPSSAYKNDERGLMGGECNVTSKFVNCGMLGADSTPVYIFPGASPWGNIHSPASFNRWFHNSDQTIVINYSIPLTQNANTNTYSYLNDAFFPIDGAGWGDFARLYSTSGTTKHAVTTYVDHNFAFCLEAHTRFGYQSDDMVFTFEGDDDVWVYIDGYLVIDLGGLHTAETKSVSLKTLPFLQLGSNYRLDFFYCERHTIDSHLQLTTSLEFYCAYTDWCGICEGNGQSCCDATKCNDNSVCTTDSCAVLDGSCTHTPINCTASDACHQAVCDPIKGCQITALTCDDGDSCTTDSCDTSKGCQHVQKNCDDGNACTADTCSGGTCAHAQKNCDDSNACTIDSCGSDGACLHTTNTCDDGNKCTKDTCDTTKGCSNTLNCDDGNLCTTDTCVSNTTGCTSVPVDCSTSNKCINSACSSTTGKCVQTNVTCAYKDACNIATCNSASGCQYAAPDCDDKNPCTTDTCDTTSGCKHTNITCTDNNPCTIDTCSASAGGCVFTPVVTDDNNKCTTDACNAVTGVVTHTNITCTDNNDCTTDSCSATTGCLYSPKNCDDNDPCTVDSCLTTGGCQYVRQANCVGCTLNGHSVNCTTVDKCSPQSCDFVNGGCLTTTVNCNDNNNCTVDSCSSSTGQCSNIDVVCTAPTCQTAACDAANGGVCKYTNITCDDFDPCTTDKCTADGSCSHTPIAHCVSCGSNACITQDFCSPSVCNSDTQTCQPSTVSCDDSNACTTEVCISGASAYTCNYTSVVCPSTNDVCNPYVCDAKTGCGVVPVVCQDPDLCTDNICGNVGGVATCQFPAKNCSSIDPCNPIVCQVDGTCKSEPVVCQDNDPCTQDLCITVSGKVTCYFPDIDCGSDTCGEKVCNSSNGACVSAITVAVCNDGNPCTDDKASCNGTSVNCAFNVNSVCDDNNACTNEACDSSNVTAPCIRSNVTCTPASVCEAVDQCDPTYGCMFKPVVCPDQDDVCKVATCDDRAGCIVESKVCTVSDSGCYKGVCDSSKNATGEDPCTTIKLDNWGSRKSSNGILCALRYDDTVKHAVIGAGAAAGIAIGAAAALGFVGYGSKKGWDAYKAMKDQRFNSVQNNPLYEDASNAQTDNPLYRHSVTA